MTREEISAAVGGIEDKYIEEAAVLPSKKPLAFDVKRKLLPLAACLVLLAGLALYQPWLNSGMKKEDSEFATGESEAPAPEAVMPVELPSVQVKLLGVESEELRGVVTGIVDTEIFPVGTEVVLDLGEVTFLPSSSLSGGERPDQALPPDNLWMLPADAGEEVEIMFDSWEQEGDRITLYVDQLVILN